MLQIEKFACIGAGNMGSALIGGLRAHNLVAPDKVTASCPQHEQATQLHKKFGIHTTVDNVAAAKDADIICICVKPQTLDTVLKEIRSVVPSSCLIISIIAGKTIGHIAQSLGQQAIIRAMPNTPGRINEGITVWTCHESVSREQREQAAAILGALGKEIFMEDEAYLDKATALSGTGPAYVFFFMEALIDVGVHIGFPRHIAESLVLQTVCGSARYAEESKRHLAVLRNEVTSAGGTTAEALYNLEKDGFRTAIANAVWAAYKKSMELGKKS